MCKQAAAIYFLGAGSSGKRVNANADTSSVKKEKQDQQNLVTPSCEYRLPLVWIDLEMTGKHVEWVSWRMFYLYLYNI